MKIESIKWTLLFIIKKVIIMWILTVINLILLLILAILIYKKVNILDDFKKLIIKHGIYLWGCEESYENVLNSKSMWLDGYYWNIELIFNNGAIFYVGLDNEHPDSYFGFAKDVKQLFGRDLFRIKDCHYPE